MNLVLLDLMMIGNYSGGEDGISAKKSDETDESGETGSDDSDGR